MKYAYPQFPTDSLDALRRYDESSDSATTQSNLERQQDIAVVGETVPMVFCQRFDWGGNLGVNGGVWISPRLIQLGLTETSLSMMYLLSQGEIRNLKTDLTYWGYNKLKDVDSGARMCFAYEAVPDCLDLDYEPGGSLNWTTTLTAAGPNIGNGVSSFTTVSNCVKIVVTFTANIRVNGSATIVGGYDGFVELYENQGQIARTTNGNGQDFNVAGNYAGCAQTLYYNRSPTSSRWQGNFYIKVYDYGLWHLSASWEQTSEIRYNWRVIDVGTDAVVKSGQIWIKDSSQGSQSLTIDDLPKGEYKLEFFDPYKERNKTVQTVSLQQSKDACSWLYGYDAASEAYYNPPSDGFFRHTHSGSETKTITTSITQTTLDELEFPELPGGDGQIVGGLSDLTMLGITGDVTLLRPQEGPDYFIQSHIFVENGIRVKRLTLGGTGSSPYYGDLVNYLLEKTNILKSDQIDKDSLALANRLNSNYDLYFNGVLQTTNSLSEWLTRTAPYFLLTPRQVDGKFGLWPVCPLNGSNQLSRGTTSPALVVTRDDIVKGSYSRNYISPRDRRPICLVMVYRDQPSSSVGQTVTVEVRYPGTALSGPFETHDMTEFCCRAEQAVYAARYILAKRRYTTHTVAFAMTRRGAQLKPGDIIQVDLSTTTTDGEGIADAIFYQIEAIAEGQSGSIQVEATHFPTATLNDKNDVSVVAYETHEGDVTIQ